MHRDDYAYQQMKSSSLSFCGMPETPTPVILLRDLDLIKRITIRKFDHFTNRRDFIPIPNPKENIMSDNVGMIKGERWKGVRSSITPTFTSGKIRRMSEHFNLVSLEWTKMLRNQCSKTGTTDVDVLNVSTQYVVEVIASAVFGMQSGSISNPSSPFFAMASRLSQPSFIDILKLNIGTRYPSLFTTFGIDVFDKKAINFFVDLLRKSLDARKSGSIVRNDFQQLMLEEMQGSGRQWITENVIVANSLLFFIAGLQSTSAFVAFCIWVLAANPDIQKRLQEEVDEVKSLMYDDVQELTYMGMFMCEVLRMYPLAVRVERECTQDYHDEETRLYIRKGATVAIPVHAIHYDETYWPEPNKFDPDRFGEKGEWMKDAFMPFGIGPRGCLGMRFALAEVKTAIAQLIKKFEIQPNNKTVLPVTGVSGGLLLFPPKGLEVQLKIREGV